MKPHCDYKKLHLAFLTTHPRFLDKNGDYTHSEYMEVMSYTYKNPLITNELAYLFMKTDVRWYVESQSEIQEMLQMVKAPPLPDSLFITINFNHQTWTPQLCHTAIENLLTLSWIKTACAVFELHRENGQHPHVHILLTTDRHYTKTRIIDKIYAAKKMKDLIAGKQFIDYKIAEPYHLNYTAGNKKPEKMQYVEKDNIWKEMQGLPYNYIKKSEKPNVASAFCAF